MTPKIEHREAMTMIGYHTEIAPDEGYVKCPEFWDLEYAKKYARLWQTMQPQTAVERAVLENRIGMYTICADEESGFSYWIAGEYRGGAVPEGLELYTLPAGDWAVFTARGPIPASLQALNTEIWQHWLPTEGRRMEADASVSVEVYSAGDPQSEDYECGIRMPVRKPGRQPGTEEKT